MAAARPDSWLPLPESVFCLCAAESTLPRLSLVACVCANEMDFCWPKDPDTARQSHHNARAGQDLFRSRADLRRLDALPV